VEVKLKRGELAEMAGVNTETLRFYEKSGLIAPERGANGYRLYLADDVKRVKMIQRAVNVGFSLDNIRGWLAGDEAKIREALAEIDSKIEELDKLKKNLRKRLRAI
jgi:MerR family transcriptional regulator, copper efflux regulator